MKFVGNISFTLISRSLVAVINFIMIVITSRVLGPEGRGDIALLMTDVSITMMIFGIVGGSTVIYHLPKYKSIIKVILFALLLLVPVIVLSNITFDFIHPSVYRSLVTMMMLVVGLSTVGLNVLIGRKEIVKYSLLSLLAPLFTLLVFYFHRSHSIETYLQAYLIGQSVIVLGLFSVWKQVFISKIELDTQAWKKIATYGITNEMAGFIQFVSYRASLYVLFWYVNKAEAGKYANALVLCESLWIISRSIALNQYSEIVNEPDKAVLITKKSLKYIIVLMLPAIVLLLLLPQELYAQLFGNKFDGIKQDMIYLLPGVFALAVSSSWANYFSAIGKVYINNIKAFTGTVVIAISLVVLVPLYGRTGAAIATSLSYISSFFVLVYFYYVKKNPC